MLLDLKKLKSKYEMSIRGVIHIGAHFGEENSLYDSLGIVNRIYFEPLKSNFSALRANVGDQYKLYNLALGNENKRVVMNVESANGGQSSSILNPRLHLEQYPSIIFNTTEEVEMRRLDDINIDFSQYNFINIDVQGYELEVFKGAANALNHVDYIISEINRAELYDNCAMVEDLESFLKPYGFKLVEQSWDGNTWGDGFFIKKSNESRSIFRKLNLNKFKHLFGKRF